MSNEVTEWIKELWHEIKGLPSDFKGLINKVKKVKANREMEIKEQMIEFKEDKKNMIEKREIVVKHKGTSSWFVKACLLYLCVFITVIGVGLLSFLVALNEKLPVDELSFYADRVVEFFQRADDIGGANRFLRWLYQYPELPYWAGVVEWENVTYSLEVINEGEGS